MKNLFVALTALFLYHIAPAQRVGIGITNPTRAGLEVQGAVGATSAIFGGDGTGISIMRNWPSVGFNHYYGNTNRYMANGYAAMQTLDPTAGYMAFDIFDQGYMDQACAGSKRILTLNQSGSVWIGNNPHNSTLAVSRLPGMSSTAWLYGTTHHSTFNFSAAENTYIRAGKNGGKVFINDITNGKIVMSGAVGINTNTPTYPFEIHILPAGTNYGLALVEPSTFNYWSMTIGVSGNHLYLSRNSTSMGYFKNNDGSYFAISDRRLKKNTRELPTVLASVDRLRPVSYEMKRDNPGHSRTMGFIAQEVKELFPQLVHVDAGEAKGYEGLRDLHTMNYTALHVIAIKAIQEQQEQINRQEQEITALEKEYETLVLQLEQQAKTK